MKTEIIKMKEQGLSSRYIADKLGCSKTKVNNVYNQYKEETKSGKFLFLDTETAPDIGVTFSRFKANLTQDHILQEGGFLLSIAWREGISGKTKGIALTPKEAKDANDSRLVAYMLELIEDADTIVGHNLINFDFPVIKARAVINGFHPPRKVNLVDTLKIARALRFQSNRLDSLAAALGIGRKTSTGGISLWIDSMRGELKALTRMLEYNKDDVDLLVEVYNRLKAFDSQAPNQGLFKDEQVCRVCGSTDVHTTGNTVKTTSAIYNEYKCNTCGHRQRGKTMLNTSAQRKQLLV